ncbi:unnamed protein product [Acanthoscelides obtectus]|uniref:Regulatory protein zeste n=1 Tax=Acanthoscelides obtectus TaxID=200917 RepID=A0A9P0KSW2_ACAOB|nr:unnamed protein product [Acanthoscelides obtectus]CAK1655851.1 Myb/SANT-like DNA-binding domain-containing protein 3 [Acanthoscelides obtectus]
MNNTNKNSCERKVFSERDKLLLISLVNSYKHILENKKTDATNVEKKNGAWKEITDLYNANDVCPRTDKQLRKLWENLKQRTRKSDSEMRKSLIQTGGGPPVKSEDNPINERVRSVVPTISYVIENEWDSNSVIPSENSQLQSEPNASQAFIEVTDAQSNMGDIDQDNQW